MLGLQVFFSFFLCSSHHCCQQSCTPPSSVTNRILFYYLIGHTDQDIRYHFPFLCLKLYQIGFRVCVCVNEHHKCFILPMHRLGCWKRTCVLSRHRLCNTVFVFTSLLRCTSVSSLNRVGLQNHRADRRRRSECVGMTVFVRASDVRPVLLVCSLQRAGSYTEVTSTFTCG